MRSVTIHPDAYVAPIPVLTGNAAIRVTDLHPFGDTSATHRLGTDLLATTELFMRFVDAYNGGDEGRASYVQTSILLIASERFQRGSRFSYGNNMRPMNGVLQGVIPDTLRINQPEDPKRYPTRAYFHNELASSGVVYLGIHNPGIVIEGHRRELRRRQQHYCSTVEYFMLSSTGEITLS